MIDDERTMQAVIASARKVMLKMRARTLRKSGMTYAQIAEKLHKPESTIRNILK